MNCHEQRHQSGLLADFKNILFKATVSQMRLAEWWSFGLHLYHLEGNYRVPLLHIINSLRLQRELFKCLFVSTLPLGPNEPRAVDICTG